MPTSSGTGKGPETDLKFRQLLSDLMHDRRKEIAAALTARIGRTVTVSMLNDFTATTKTGARFPAAWLPAFCEITGTDGLIRELLPCGLRTALAVGEHELALRRAERAKNAAVNELLDKESRGN